MTTPTDVLDDSRAEQPLQISSKLRNRTIIGFAIAAAILIVSVMRLNLDLGATWQAMRSADPLLYVLGFGAYYLTFPSRALRWRQLLRSSQVVPAGQKVPPVRSLAGIIFLSWFANTLVPAKLGDGYRGYELKQRTGASFSSVIGTIIAERVFDMAALAVLLVVSVIFIGRLDGAEGSAASQIMLATGVLVVLSVVGIAGLWLFRSHLPRLMPKRLHPFYERFQAGTLGSFRDAPFCFGLSFLVWSTEAARMFFVMQSLGLGLTFPHALFLSLANALLTVVPFTPGGLGLVESGMIALLMVAGVPKEQAAATALLDRTISYASIIVVGALLFPFRRRL